MFSPAQIHKNYIGVAQAKTSQKWYKMLILAVLAGAFIAFGAAVSTAVSAGYSGAKASLVKGAVFPVGLILVVICGAELFTGNCLIIAPVVGKNVKLTAALKNWGIVYLGNFIGGVLIAVLVVYGKALGADSQSAVVGACVGAAQTKSNLTFLGSLLKGILCNMLVCLAVWAAMASETVSGKIAAVYLPVLTFVACGFEHSVANMYYLSAGLMAESFYGLTAPGLTVGNAIVNSLIPATIGNIIGGFVIALVYHFVYREKSEN